MADEDLYSTDLLPDQRPPSSFWIVFYSWTIHPVKSVALWSATSFMNSFSWIAAKYTVICLQFVRYYFGLYHGVRIALDILGLLCVHLIGRIGLLRPSKLVMRFLLGGSQGRAKIALHRKLRHAQTYDEWRTYSEELDEITGQAAWCKSTTLDNSVCDFQSLESHVQALQAARRVQNWHEIAFLLRVCCNRHFCHLRNPSLYAHSFVHTKQLVEDFYEEVCLCLDELVRATLQQEPNEFLSPAPATTVGTVDHKMEVEALGRGVSAVFRRDRFDYTRVATPICRSSAAPTATDDKLTSAESDTSVSLKMSLHDLSDLLAALRLSLGRTALCLSGGGGLAISHMGVIKILLEMKMLPRVVSGSSGGALIAGLLAVHTDTEFEQDLLHPKFLENRQVFLCPPFKEQIRRFLKTGYLLDYDEFAKLTRTLIGEATFADGFTKTGRFVSITTTPSGGRSPSFSEPLVCNCINTPDVLVWSAVVASCSLPLVLPPSVLYTRPRSKPRSPPSMSRPRKPHPDRVSSPPLTKTSRRWPPGLTSRSEMTLVESQSSELSTYAPESMRFVDGSILQDIPHTELQTVFNVKSFVVSQVNPHFTPFISGPASYRKEKRLLGMMLDSLWNYLALDVRNRYARLLMLALVPKIRGQDVSPFLMQSAEGHITIVPASPTDFWRLTANPSAKDVDRGLKVGERKTWPFITRLKHTLKVETKLRELWLIVTNQLQQLDEPFERRRKREDLVEEELLGGGSD